MRSIVTGTRASAAMVLFLAVAVIAVSAGCLAHSDDGAPDGCASLLAVAVGLTLAFSLGQTPEIVFTRLSEYHAFSFDPPAPPPKV